MKRLLATGYWRLARAKGIGIGRLPVASRQLTLRSRAAGFSIVTAIFLIVVLAALGAFAVRIGAGQQQTTNLEVLSARALAAANSGIDWGAYRALAPAPNVKTCGSTTLNFTEAALNGFTVNVVCAQSTHTEGNSYRIDATATLGTYGTPDFVSRHVYATFTDAF